MHILPLMALVAAFFTLTDAEAAEMKESDLKGREAYLDRVDDLDDMQRYVTQHDGTEPPFDNAYWDNHAEGIYVDVISGEPLFSSTDKFDSGTGWPSFTQPIGANFLTQKSDRKLGMERTEVRSSTSDAHLGHVFDDGPKAKGGKRYCINSAALRFIPKDQLIAEGYPQYLALFEKK